MGGHHHHGYGHGHGHGHGHSHSHGHGASERRTMVAALLTGGFMFAELVGGLWAGSLALIADAAHMLTDAASLGLAWYAFRLGRRPATGQHTYGFGRLQVLVAFGNGLAMFFIVCWIAVEALERLWSPAPVLAGPMLVIAVLGLFVNLVSFAVLHGADRTNLNIRGALLHVVGDILGSVAAISAGAVIYFTGYTLIDPVLSLVVALLLTRSAWTITRDSARILLEAAPPGLEAKDLRQDIVGAFDDVEDVHHVHLWSLTEKQPLVTMHVRLKEGVDPDALIASVKARVRASFGISHVVVEAENARCADDTNESASCGGSPPGTGRLPSTG